MEVSILLQGTFKKKERKNSFCKTFEFYHLNAEQEDVNANRNRDADC